MKEIQLNNPHHQKHFDFFRQMDQPHFNICANVTISPFLDWIKSKSYPFTTSMVFFLSHALNQIPQFRWRLRESRIIEHPAAHPSFTVNTDLADVFSFCEVAYSPSFLDFLARADQAIAQMKEAPSLEDEAGRDDYFFMSAFPWVSFTSFQHAMDYRQVDSVPRIAWGKYFEEGGERKMPLSIQAHHALVDGRHMGAGFELVEEFLQNPEKILD